MSTPGVSKTTTAFHVQAIISFAIALTSVTVGIWFLPADAWIRAFLSVATLFLVTSTFTLAKVIRDAQETDQVVSRIDQARVEKILAEHDPFHPMNS